MIATQEQISKAIEKYADEMLAYQESRGAPPEGMPQSEIDAIKKKARDGWAAYATSFMADCQSADTLYARWRGGAFMTRNNAYWRPWFTMITGVTLPSTNKATDVVIRAYLGEGFCDAKERAANAKKWYDEISKWHVHDVYCRRHLAEIEADFRSGLAISGDCLLQLARRVGVDIYPRTA